jgi:hypothetical protein
MNIGAVMRLGAVLTHRIGYCIMSFIVFCLSDRINHQIHEVMRSCDRFDQWTIVSWTINNVEVIAF